MISFEQVELKPLNRLSFNYKENLIALHVQFIRSFHVSKRARVYSINILQVLGVFFPTCTGLMAGVNMQGDLKNPHNNISTGSLASLAFRFVSFLLDVLPLCKDSR